MICCLHSHGQSWETSSMAATAWPLLSFFICPAGCQDSSLLLKERMVLMMLPYHLPSPDPSSTPPDDMMKYRILWNIETGLTKYEDIVIDSASSQCRSRRGKLGVGKSPPGSSRKLQNLSGVQPLLRRSSIVARSPGDQQDLDHEYEVWVEISLCKSYRLSAITYKAGAGVLSTSLVQGWKVFHKAGLAILGHLCISVLWGTPV